MTKKQNKYIFAFIIPILFAVIGLALSGIFPFFGKSIVSSDLGMQYMPISSATVRMLRNFDLSPVSYEMSFGVDFLNVNTTFSSILNVLLLFFDIKYQQDIYYFIYILKIGFAGLFAFTYLEHSCIIKNNACIDLAFATLYALCMHFVYYVLLITMLDCAVLLPLCFLFVEKLDKRPILFFAAYFGCVLNSYYYAYSAGIMCFLYFVYYHSVINSDIKTISKQLLKLVSAALATVGVLAFLLIPSLSATSKISTDLFDDSPFSPIFYFNFSELCDGAFFISDKIVRNTALNIRFGILPLILPIMLVLSPKAAAAKERAAAGLISVFMALALTLKPLYLLMHLCRIPQEFHARFAYGIVLLCIIFSSRMIMQYKNINKKMLAVPFLLILIGLGSALPLHTHLKYLVFSILTLAVCGFYVLLFSVLAEKKYFIKLTAAAITAEAFINAAAGFYITDTLAAMPPRSEFITYYENSKHIKDVLDKTDNGFYRCYDITDNQTMSQLYGGYNSYSFFSSTADRHPADLAEALGCYRVAPNALGHQKASIITDSIFGVKYIAAQKDKKVSDINGNTVYPDASGRLRNDSYKKIYEDEKIELYENISALPILFAADEALKDAVFENNDAALGSCFAAQQGFINTAAAERSLFFTEYDIGEPRLENCELESDGLASLIRLTNLSDGNIYAKTTDEGGHITYSFTAPADGEYCSDFLAQTPEGAEDTLLHIINRTPTSNTGLKKHIYYDLGFFKAGEEICIEFYDSINNAIITKPSLYMYDPHLFMQTAQKIKNASPTNIKQENGIITADADFSEKRFIVASVTYSDNYKIYIDGRETQKFPVCNAFMGFYVPEGQHSIKIEYKRPFKKGAAISIVTAIIIFIYFKNKGEHKNEKETF